MKIAFLTSHLTGIEILNEFASNESIRHLVGAIATDDPLGNCCNAQARLWKHGLTDCLPAELMAVAKTFNVPINTGPVNVTEYVDQLVNNHVTAIIMSCFGQILDIHPAGKFACFQGLVWNIHPAFVDQPWPSCRGKNAYDELIGSGENQFRLVLHKAIKKEDQGEEVKSSSPIPIHPTDQPIDLMRKAAPVSAQLVLDFLADDLLVTDTEVLDSQDGRVY